MATTTAALEKAEQEIRVLGGLCDAFIASSQVTAQVLVAARARILDQLKRDLATAEPEGI